MNTPLIKQIDQNEMDMRLICEECKDIISPGVSFAEYLYESVSNHNAICKYMMESEIAYYAKYGTVIEFAGATGNGKTQGNIVKRMIDIFLGFISKARKWLSDKWDLFMRKIEDTMLGNKKFLIEYGGKLKYFSDTIELEGYDFSYLDDAEPVAFTIVSRLDNNICGNTGLQPDKNTYINNMKKIIASGILKDDVDPTKVEEYIMQMYYGSGKYTMNYNVRDQLEYINNTSRDKARVSKMFKSAMNELKIMERMIASWKSQGDAGRGNYDMEKLEAYLEIIRYNIDVLSKAFSSYIEALLLRCKQAKVICMLAIQKLNESAGINESINTMHLRKDSLNDIYNKID